MRRGSSKRDLPPGVFLMKTSGARPIFGAKVWIRGESHNLGCFPTAEAAGEFVRCVESRNPDRLLRRVGGSIERHGRRYVVRAPRPDRRVVGRFDTRWAAERVFRTVLAS